MHSIRSKARRAAWTTNGNAPNYNPFARTRSNDKRLDEESGLRSRLETHLESAIEEQRRLESRQAGKEFPSPQHASTAPPASASTEKPLLMAPGRRMTYGERPQSLQGTSKESASTSDTLIGSQEGFRNRLMFKNPLRTFTEESEKSAKNERQKAVLRREIPIAYQMRALLFGTWINILFAVIPAGFAVYYTHRNPITVFCVNFIAIVPSSTLLSFSVDELGIRVGDKLEALLSMTFSNMVQLITSILLLKSRQVDTLRASLLGSILTNLLMMTGLGFLLGGFKRIEQHFNAAVAQTISMLLLLAVVSLLIPTASHIVTDTTPGGILAQSRGTSVVILISYGLWLLFQLKTNRSMFREPAKSSPKRKSSKFEEGGAFRAIAQISAGTAAASGGAVNQVCDPEQEADEDEFNEPQLSLLTAIAALTVSTALIAFNTSFATDSIQGVLQYAGLSKTFLGLVILPILSVDPTSIFVAIQDKMDMSISLTLERCMQTCLMVVLLVVLLAWCMKIDTMTLEFDSFSITALFASIIIVTYVVQEGKSNWLIGALLIKVYIIIALAAFYIH